MGPLDDVSLLPICVGLGERILGYPGGPQYSLVTKVCERVAVVVIHRQSAVLGRNTSVRDASSRGNHPRIGSGTQWSGTHGLIYEGAIGKPTSLSDPLVDIWQRYSPTLQSIRINKPTNPKNVKQDFASIYIFLSDSLY